MFNQHNEFNISIKLFPGEKTQSVSGKMRRSRANLFEGSTPRYREMDCSVDLTYVGDGGAKTKTIIFNGGTALDWLRARDEITLRIREKDLAGLLDGTLTFNVPRPIHEARVTNVLQGMIQTTQEAYVARVRAIMHKYGIDNEQPPINGQFPDFVATHGLTRATATALLGELVKEYNDLVNQRTSVEMKRPTMEHEFERQVSEWERREERHRERVNKGLEILEKGLGDEAIQMIRVELAARDVAACLNRLDTLYLHGQPLERLRLQVIENLKMKRFDRKLHTLPNFLLEFDRDIRTAENPLHPYPDALKIDWLKICLKDNEGEFDTAFWRVMLRDPNLTYNRAKEEVIDHYNRCVLEYREERSRERLLIKEHRERRYEGAYGVKCYACGKEGHTARNCRRPNNGYGSDRPTQRGQVGSSRGETRFGTGRQDRSWQGTSRREQGRRQTSRRYIRSNSPYAGQVRKMSSRESGEGKEQGENDYASDGSRMSRSSRGSSMSEKSVEGSRYPRSAMKGSNNSLQRRLQGTRRPASSPGSDSGKNQTFQVTEEQEERFRNKFRKRSNQGVRFEEGANCMRVLSYPLSMHSAVTDDAHCTQVLSYPLGVQSAASERTSCMGVLSYPLAMQFVRCELSPETPPSESDSERRGGVDEHPRLEGDDSQENPLTDVVPVTKAREGWDESPIECHMIQKVRENEDHGGVEDSYESDEEINNLCVLKDRKTITECKEACGLTLSNLCLDYILDSGATMHMIPERYCFDTYERCEGMAMAAGGELLPVVGRGRVGILDHVLHVPKLKQGLISIMQLDENGYTTVFNNGVAQVIDRKRGEVVMAGRKEKKLYHLKDCLDAETNWEGDTENTENLETRVRDIIGDDDDDELREGETDDLDWEDTSMEVEEINAVDEKKGTAAKKGKWSSALMSKLEHLHHRWGHVSIDVIKEALRHKGVNGALVDYDEIKDESIRLCPSCEIGKPRHSNFHGSEEVQGEIGPLEMMAFDIKGPMKVASYENGYRYANVFSFKMSGWILVYFGKYKTSFFEHFKRALTFAEKMDQRVKVIQSDDDPIFRAREFVEEVERKRLTVRKSFPYDHSGNGWIERAIGKILNMVRTIMEASDCPASLWPFAFSYAVHVLNRTPRRDSDWKSPYELLHGKKPDISYFVPFYSLGVIKLAKEQARGEMGWRGDECRMLGYDLEGKNGYVVINLRTKEMVRTKEAVFDENYGYKNDDEYFAQPYINPGFKYGLEGEEERKISSYRDFFGEEGDDRYWSQFEEEKEREGINNVMLLVMEEQERGPLRVVKAPYSPKTVEEALRGPEAEQWKKAIDAELEQLESRGTFRDLTEEEIEGKRIASMKMVLQGSLDNNMQPKYKARLVLRGFSQLKGVDYDETYSPTVMKDSIFLCLIIGQALGFKKKLMDVKGAFLEGVNSHDIYAEIPRSVLPPGAPRRVVKVILSLYGEKQAANEWFKRLDEIMVKEIGLTRLDEECIYTWRNEDGELELLTTIHVDDILIFGKTEEIIECFIEEFRRHVTETKVYPDVKKYLGMELVEQDGKIYVSQENYISKIIRKYTEKGRSRRQKNPISMSLKLEDVQNENEETWDIRDLVGSLRYVADCTRRDILTALSIISAKAGRASESYCKGADQIIDYLLTTCGSYLEFSQNRANNLYLYACWEILGS